MNRAWRLTVGYESKVTPIALARCSLITMARPGKIPVFTLPGS